MSHPEESHRSADSLVNENQRLRERVAALEAAALQLAGKPGQPMRWELQRVAEMCDLIGGSLDMGQAVKTIATGMLEIFACDRAWMLNPCDPEASTWQVPIEACGEAWPSALPETQDLQMLPGHAAIFRHVLEADGIFTMDRAACEAADPALVEMHSVQSQMMALLKPERGAAWLLGMHQCSHERVWSESDKSLLQHIAARVTPMLGCLLVHQELEQREERLALALECVQDGVWDWDVQSGMVIYSESLTRMLGYELAEFDASLENWRSLVHPEDLVRVNLEVEQLLAEGSESFRSEYRLRTKSGKWKWILDRGKVVQRASDGRALRALGTHKDIGNAKQTERMLMRERRLFIGGPCIVFRWVAAAGWPVEYVSPNVKSFFGHSAEDFMTGRVPYVEVVYPEDLARVAEEVREHSASGTLTFEQEYRIVRPSGEIRWLYDFTVVNRNEAGEITHFEGYVLDCTERKEAEARRLNLEAQIQQAQKLESLGILAGGIAHDFNNLLMGVLGHADLAMGLMPVSSPAIKNLRGIKDAAKQAAELTHQMLAYSGKGRFLVESLSVNDVIEEMTRLLEVSISKTAILRIDLAPNLPAVEADGSQLRQVIMNLITNAAEAVGDRSGVISISTGAMFCDLAYLASAFHVKELPEGTYVYFEVADTGDGMDRVTLDRIFDPFFTTKFTGRGLGLAAVQGIVRGHAGAICVYSEVKRGTTFKVLLPATMEPARARPSSSPEADWSGSGTVLIVDDEETVRTIGCLMLHALGLQTLTAEDGPQALDVFRNAGPGGVDCVLLDLTMPHMNGDEVFRELRRMDKKVRVILSSGYNQADIVQRFSGKGLAGFIQKPYGRDALAEVLREAFQGAPRLE